MAARGSLRLVSSKFADSPGIHIVKLAKSYAHAQRALGGVTVDRGRHQGPFGINIRLRRGRELWRVPGLGPVGLEQAEPDLLMEGKHGTACQSRLIGTWPTTGDGGRVDQLFHAGADEGDAEQVAVVLVDDHAGAAGIAAYRPARHCLAGSTSITRMRYPARSAWSAVSPTAPAARAHR